MIKLTTRTPWGDYAVVMANRQPFKTSGSFRAEAYEADPAKSEINAGRLPYHYRPSLYMADYVIYSYDTPIAWHSTDDGWQMPDEKYSTTTSRHQSKIFFIKDWIKEGVA